MQRVPETEFLSPCNGNQNSPAGAKSIKYNRPTVIHYFEILAQGENKVPPSET